MPVDCARAPVDQKDQEEIIRRFLHVILTVVHPIPKGPLLARLVEGRTERDDCCGEQAFLYVPLQTISPPLWRICGVWGPNPRFHLSRPTSKPREIAVVGLELVEERKGPALAQRRSVWRWRIPVVARPANKQLHGTSTSTKTFVFSDGGIRHCFECTIDANSTNAKEYLAHVLRPSILYTHCPFSCLANMYPGSRVNQVLLGRCAVLGVLVLALGFPVRGRCSAVVLVNHLLRDTVEHVLAVDAEQRPGQVKRLVDGP